jgi:branched-chain amino acid transport system substrate-binding protein
MRARVLIGVLSASAAVLTGCGGASGGASGSGGSGGNVPGVTDTEIHLGATTPLSGPAASYSESTRATEAYFKYINDQGGINGRKITYTLYDDGYDPSKTVPLTDKLVNQDKVFAIVGGVGTAPQSAVYKKLNAQKVPDVLIGSGASSFTNPVLPYVTQLLPNYPGEDTLLAKHTKDTYPGKKVGVIYQNDDAGKDYVGAFTKVLGGSVGPVTSYEQTDADLSSQVTSLKSGGAEVVAFNGTPKFLALALKSARSQNWPAPFVASGPAVDASLLATAGPAAEGLVTATGFRSATDTSDPEVKKANDILAKYAPGIKPGTATMWGIAGGEIVTQALKEAGKNLTREGLVNALDKLKLTQGTFYGTVTMSPTQHDAVRCEQLLTVTNGVLTRTGDVTCPSE